MANSEIIDHASKKICPAGYVRDVVGVISQVLPTLISFEGNINCYNVALYIVKNYVGTQRTCSSHKERFGLLFQLFVPRGTDYEGDAENNSKKKSIDMIYWLVIKEQNWLFSNERMS